MFHDTPTEKKYEQCLGDLNGWDQDEDDDDDKNVNEDKNDNTHAPSSNGGETNNKNNNNIEGNVDKELFFKQMIGVVSPSLTAPDSHLTQDLEEYTLEQMGYLHPPTSDVGTDSNSHSSGSSSSSDEESETEKNEEEGVDHEDCTPEAKGQDTEVVEPPKTPTLLVGMTGKTLYHANHKWYKIKILSVGTTYNDATICTVKYTASHDQQDGVPVSRLQGMSLRGSINDITPLVYEGMPSCCRAASGMRNEADPYYPGIVKRIIDTSTISYDSHDADCDECKFEFEFATGAIITATMGDLLFERVPKSGYLQQRILKDSPKKGRATTMTATNNSASFSNSSSCATKRQQSPKRKINVADSDDDEFDAFKKDLIQIVQSDFKKIRSDLKKREETITKRIHAQFQTFKSKKKRAKQNHGGSDSHN